MTSTINYFICHASEDKASFVRPLAQHLARNGASIFYDEYSLKLGDSLTSKINEGLKISRNAIIVLSNYFFEKSWTNVELHGIFQRHLSGDYKLLIIYHGITHAEVLNRFPLLADILAVDSKLGVNEVARQIFEATDFKPQIGFGQLKLDGTFASIKETGFSAAIRFQINIVADQYIDKYVLDFGNIEQFGSRASLRLVRNRDLVAKFTDSSGRSISLSCPAEIFFQAPQFLVMQISPSRSAIELYVNGALVSQLGKLSEEFIDSVSISGNCIMFNSIELVHPIPATVSFYAMGKELSSNQVLSLFQSVDMFNKELGR